MTNDDEPAACVTAGDVTVERDHACFRGLAWRATIAAGAGAEVQAALAATMTDVTRDPRLIAMRTDDGHHVIVVPATGRVQLRLDLGSDPRSRPAIALDLARRVLTARAG